MAADPKPAARNRGVLRLLARSPFLQFLCLGGLIFLAAHIADQWRARTAAEIVVDQNDVRRIAALYEAQMGAPPSPEQLDALVDRSIHDEILFREAKRMGLGDGDEIVKRRLVQKLEFLATRVPSSSAPSDQDLRRYYAAHRERFARPATVDFVHVYFSPDKGGAAKAEARATAALGEIGRPGADTGRLGDPFPLQATYVGLTKSSVIQLFGGTPIVDALFELPPGAWAGPYRSGYGWHLIRITARKPAAAPPFEDIRDDVAAALRQDRQDRAAAEAYEAMKARYTIVRPEKAAP
jgi:peptidyl-prolyl cis-trans isomerase C